LVDSLRWRASSYVFGQYLLQLDIDSLQKSFQLLPQHTVSAVTESITKKERVRSQVLKAGNDLQSSSSLLVQLQHQAA